MKQQPLRHYMYGLHGVYGFFDTFDQYLYEQETIEAFYDYRHIIMEEDGFELYDQTTRDEMNNIWGKFEEFLKYRKKVGRSNPRALNNSLAWRNLVSSVNRGKIALYNHLISLGIKPASIFNKGEDPIVS